MMTPLLNNGYKGIIHAGVGNGNIHKNIFPSLIDARKKGILVVRSSRVPTGPTTLDAEVDDAKYQFCGFAGVESAKVACIANACINQNYGLEANSAIF